MAIFLTIVILNIVTWIALIRLNQLYRFRGLSKFIGFTVRLSALVLLLLTGASSTLQARGLEDNLVFVPSSGDAHGWNPDAVPFKPEDVYYHSASGNKIHAWRIRPQLKTGQKPDCYIIYFHGNSGNLTHHYYFYAWLVKHLNAEVFAVDCSGYGKSSGKPSEENCYADVRSGMKKFAELAGIQPMQIIPMGRSLGGAIATQLAMDMQKAGTPCRALILESTFTSIPDMADTIFPIGLGMFVQTQMNTKSKLAQYTGSVLITHGKRDSVVPYKQAVTNYKSVTHQTENGLLSSSGSPETNSDKNAETPQASNRKIAFLTHSLDHMDIPDGYADKLKEFLTGQLEGEVEL